MELELLNKLQELGVTLNVSEGDLKVKAPKGVISKNLIQEIKIHKEKFIEIMSNRQKSIPIAKFQKEYPLTSSQKRLWFLNQFDGGGLAYNIPLALNINGRLDIEILQEVFQKLIERHEILRTIFEKNIDGEVFQRVISMKDFHFTIRLKEAPENNDQTYVEELINKELQYKFQLDTAPLLRVLLIKKTTTHYVLFININHIICDGLSIKLFIKELFESYNSRLNNTKENLPSLSIQHKDYALWLLSDGQQSKLVSSEKYWLEKLTGTLTILELPTSKARPLLKTYNGKTNQYFFSKTLNKQLLTFAKQNGASLFMVLTAGINGLLYKYTNAKDIILGTSVAGREHTDLENQIGLFLNTVTIRTFLNPKDNFTQLLQLQKRELLDCYAHQNYPFDILVNKLNLKRDTSRSALFDILVELHEQEEEVNFCGSNQTLNITSYPIHRPVSQFDITFSFIEKEKGLSLALEFNTDLYDEVFIDRLVEHFEIFISNAVNNPTKSIAETNYLSTEELYLLESFNNTSTSFDTTKTIIDIFESQVKLTPYKTAIKYNTVSLTYIEVNEKANQLAHYLTNVYNIGTDNLVVLLMERSELFLITVLGIWKAGAAYIPLEPDFPDERIKDILETSQSNLIISEDKSITKWLKSYIKKQQISSLLHKKVYKNESIEDLNKNISVSDLSYVIFTSGSTGKPKGAMIEHLGMLNHLDAKINTLNLNKKSVVAQNASQCFDISVWQFFSALLKGGTTVVYGKEDILHPESFIKKIKDDDITILEVVPSYLAVLMDYEESGNLVKDAYQNIDQLLVTGEALITTVSNRWVSLHPTIPLVNAYGPTEASDDITQYVINKEHQTSIPIGTTLQNLNIYILDEYLNKCGIGIKGELCVSGIGVGRGYLNDFEKTAEVFIKDPFKTGVKMYKTGDIARFREDGVIEYFGRKDFQVKIRGYRIELEEIENVLLQQKTLVKNAVVSIQTINSEKQIIAYIVPNKKLNEIGLKKRIQEKLPHYMIPAAFVEIEAIPLSSNGKVDRRALSEITNVNTIDRTYVTPRNETEEVLVQIWKEILNTTQEVGITDNFFELGGHSLKAIQLINKIKIKLGYNVHVKDIFLFPTIEELQENWVKQKYLAIPKAPIKPYYPLSSQQHRLWILSKFDGGNVAYNIPMAFWLEGVWNTQLIERAFKILIKRHESLRTQFIEDENGLVWQEIKNAEAVNFNIEYGVLQDVQEEKVQQIVKHASRHDFNLQIAPLFNITILKSSDNKQLLLFNLHHIIGDGWSMEIIMKEILIVYKMLLKEETPYLTPLNIQYKDYTLWLQSNQKQEALREQEAYWLNKFSGEISILELPTYKNRPVIKTYNGATFTQDFSEQLTQKLKQLSEDNNATLFMTLMAATKGIFFRYTNTSDIVIGTPIAGRNHPDLESQVGLFLNTLAIRTNVKGNNTFEELLNLEKQELLDAYAHQDYPFDSLVNSLKLKQDTGRSALFDIMLELHNYQDVLNQKNQNQEYDIVALKNTNRGVSQFDMTFSFMEKDNQLQLYLEYNTDIYNQELIQTLVTHLTNFLKSIAENPKQKIEEIIYISLEEENKIMNEFNGATVELPYQKTIVDVFEERVRETPKAIALQYEGNYITYEELNTKANQLAYHFTEYYEIKQDSLVCILMNRSDDFVISILAVWKAGGAYIPIDPDYPEKRIKNIVTNSKSKLILYKEVSAFLLKTFNEQNINTVDLQKDYSEYKSQNLEKTIATSNLSYVIYTSGSTGSPKGAMVEHLGMLNHLYAKINTLKLTNKSIVAQNASQCFDISVWQFFSALMVGGKTIIYSKKEVLNPINFIKKLHRDKVTILEVVPSYLSVVMDYQEINSNEYDFYNHLTYLMVTGETLTPAVANKWISEHPTIPLVNAYGPTEASDDITQYELNTKHLETIPIGTTLQNLNIYILDNENRLCGIGVKGELCVSGICVGRGYLFNPEKTASVFIEDPYKKGVRLYKTGDIARYRHDGVIEFFGRKDFQVKIRGHRIELGEIETVILQLEQVKSAVAEVKIVNEQKVIVAYIVTSSPFDKVIIQQALENWLPNYMVPHYFIQLDSIPLTENGKINRKALPEVNLSEQVQKEQILPNNEREKKLLVIWKDVLKTKTIGTTDDFFELGGNSLSVGVMIAKIKSEFKISISFSKFYLNATIKATALLIKNNELNSSEDIIIKLKDGDDKAPLFIIHPIGGNASSYVNLINNLDISNAIYGIQSQGLFDENKVLTDVESMASIYIKAIEQIQKEGPYNLLGWSFGGVIAIEMVHQFADKNAETQHLFLIDTYNPYTIKKEDIHFASEKEIAFALLLEHGFDPIKTEKKLEKISKEEQFQYLWTKILKTEFLSEDEQRIIDRFMKVFRANEIAFYNHKPKKIIHCNPHFFRAMKSVENIAIKENISLQWKNVVKGTIKTYPIEANHYSMLDEEHAKQISESIALAYAFKP